MKKFLMMVSVAMMTVVNVNAQDGLKHEVGVFYGIGSASNVLSVITSSISAAAGNQSSFWGPIGVEYYYHVSPVVGLGAEDETLVSFMFQATALGAEFGGEQFRGFVEAGFGEKGVLCAGLRYKF